MAFGIAPAGFVQDVGDQFPTFIQWQQDGVDLGGPDVDTVDLAAGIVGTRGVGEHENVLTLSAAMEITAQGVPFPLPVTGLDISTGITAVQDEFGVVTLTTDAPPEFVWRDVIDDDTVIEVGDIANGIRMISDDPHVVTISDLVLPGRSVLVMQKGTGAVTFAFQSGVDIEYRAVFAPGVAQQFGIVTLIGQPDGTVLLCGDMATA